MVAPLAGAWIEISINSMMMVSSMSLPSRERGLKYPSGLQVPVHLLSLPSRERGLKLEAEKDYILAFDVAPLAGAWIEIYIAIKKGNVCSRRSPRGSVD